MFKKLKPICLTYELLWHIVDAQKWKEKFTEAQEVMKDAIPKHNAELKKAGKKLNVQVPLARFWWAFTLRHLSKNLKK